MEQQRAINRGPSIGTSSSTSPVKLNNDGTTLNFCLDQLPYSGSVKTIGSGNRFQRFYSGSSGKEGEILTDRFKNGSICVFMQSPAQGKSHLILHLGGDYHLTSTQGSGWLVRSTDSGKPHYWLPLPPMGRSYDKLGRIVYEKALPIIEMKYTDSGSFAIFRIPENSAFIEWIMWTLPWNKSLLEELHTLSMEERQPIFLWGSHLSYAGPKDLYQYLIHGAVYKTHVLSSNRPWRRPYCEVDAHALYVTLHSLWKMTNKEIYQHLKTQLVFSVITRQDEDGGWRHGSWTDYFEVHFRHHCSGIHMLAADYDETKDPIVEASLKKAVDYLRLQYDTLEVGNWYLHDSLELSEEAMKLSPITYQYSRVLGKSPSNMLVVNTHLDSLVALHRYGEATGQNFLEKDISSGIEAAIAVLGLNPAETLYRLLFKAVELTFLPDSAVRKLSLWKRVVRRIAGQKIIPLLPRLKNMFPRLVMPNGYIDRNMSLNEFWYPYFLINIMDLLRFQGKFNRREIEPIIERAFGFLERVSLEKWLNDERTVYSVGFLAEAQYLYCLKDFHRNRDALAKTVMSLHDSGQGLPPSLLGNNSEFIPLKEQVPCLPIQNEEIRVINLSLDPDHLEFLVVNSANSPQNFSVLPAISQLIAINKDNEMISYTKNLGVPARGWIRIISANNLEENG